MEKKRNNIIEKETHLSFQNSKSVDYEKFKKYLQEKDKLNKETTEFYKRDVWRKMKFRQYSYGKKSIDIFLNKIKETLRKVLFHNGPVLAHFKVESEHCLPFVKPGDSLENVLLE